MFNQMGRKTTTELSGDDLNNLLEINVVICIPSAKFASHMLAFRSDQTNLKLVLKKGQLRKIDCLLVFFDKSKI